ncbi:DEAD/DEAH box helicase family protein [Gordonia sp. i37]|uniref:DEAD/DEAH box helicase n=1 Tax=Gordonia sp. i37 TaxID=1961707 RepID=UPI0009AC8187|nr:DEAD/DEAH box helicase family protein [Gordonia sp. i37]OPX17051.1 type III restriction endonuclease subunit R [Gordonia sp. i37]
MQTLGDSVLGEITRVGPLTSVELAERLSQTVTAVQKVLLDNDQVFVQPQEGADEWRVVSSDDLASRLGMNRPLRPWQVEAFQKWLAAGRSGVIEAVTGAGKTDVGIAAIAEARRRGVPALVLAPDRDLVDHWRSTLEAAFPGVEIGAPDGSKALAIREQIVVTTVSGLGKRHLTAFRDAGLLVVDEIQRLGVADYTDVVFPRQEITEKLGLTASYEWSNPQAERILRPYFGALIDGCDYRRAVDEGLLGEPLVLTVGVRFSLPEREKYDGLTARIDRAERKLRDTGVDLSGGVYETAREIDSGTLVGEISFLAREYLEAVDARKWVLSECKSKIAAVEVIARGVADARRTTVFTASHEMSAAIATAAGNSGVVTDAVPESGDVAFMLGRYASGSVDVLATSRLLDDGVTVPTSQVGVVTAAARSRAQMLQRMGRVVHPADWAGPTAMVVVYVNATVEDPDVGSTADTHLDELLAVAAERDDLDPRDAARRLSEWLAPISTPEDDAEVDEPTTVVEPAVWNPRDAIFDIFAELEGIVTWRELRELLPDLEVEQALMQGFADITWMRIGDETVGLGGRGSDTVDVRVVALDALAQVFNVVGDESLQQAGIQDLLIDRDLVLGSISSARLSELWVALGGRVAELEQTEQEKDSAPDEAVQVGDDAPDSATSETPAPIGPALRAVIQEIEAQGWSARTSDEYSRGTLIVSNSQGQSRVVRVHSGAGGSWRISTQDQHLWQGSGEHDAVVFLDQSEMPPAFYIAPVGPYSKRVKHVIDARAKSSPRERHEAHINIEAWVVKDGLGRWNLLKLSEPETISTSPEKPSGVPTPAEVAARSSAARTASTTTIPVEPEAESEDDLAQSDTPAPQEEQVPVATTPGLVWAEGRLRVVLDYEGCRVVGFFDPESSALEIVRAQGAASLSGRTFRNPAVAAGTVKSTISNKTVFGVGFNDWVVDENTRETLAGYLTEADV